MAEVTDSPENSSKAPSGNRWNLRNAPGIQELMVGEPNPNSKVNDAKVRRLYLQATSQQWFGPDRINFDAPINLTLEERESWTKISQVFFTLEKMGLNVINLMTTHAVRHIQSNEVAYYLAVQAADEARHVFLLESYLKKLGVAPKYDKKLHVLGQAASLGLYRVENWLFSTLFSENFASSYLRRARNLTNDEIGSSIYKNLQMDESRHIHFLHIVLPDLYDRMSFFAKHYVRFSQGFIMKFSEVVSRALDSHTTQLGIDRRALIEEVFENVERAYAGFGVNPRFLPFPKISSTPN